MPTRGGSSSAQVWLRNRSTTMLTLMFITNDPALASFVVDCGVERVFVDLERLGKEERQGRVDSVKSDHSIEDVVAVRSAIPGRELLVRVNPLYEGTATESENAVQAGADLLMLPMFRRVEELREFVRLVDGRAGVIPLVETADAYEAIEAVVAVQGVHEVFIGLNDMHLDMNLPFIFEPVALGMMDRVAEVAQSAGLPFGFGGIARVGEGMVPGDIVLGEHVRLGSSSVILSRTFHRKASNLSTLSAEMDFEWEIRQLRIVEAALRARSPEATALDHEKFVVKVRDVSAARST